MCCRTSCCSWLSGTEQRGNSCTFKNFRTSCPAALLDKQLIGRSWRRQDPHLGSVKAWHLARVSGPTLQHSWTHDQPSSSGSQCRWYQYLAAVGAVGGSCDTVSRSRLFRSLPVLRGPPFYRDRAVMTISSHAARPFFPGSSGPPGSLGHTGRAPIILGLGQPPEAEHQTPVE